MNKAPFWMADLALLGTACLLVALGSRPLTVWEGLSVAACVGLGGWLAVLPFLREYEASLRWAETDRLADTSAKLEQLDTVADRIAGATGQWQVAQESARQTAEVAKGVVERLAREAEAFASAVSRTSDGEKQTLKLEVDKLRRAEGEWLQAVARIMDHVFALHLAAVRSSNPAVVEQLDRFHAACREALRRVGFVPVVATPDEAFDPRKHQTADGARPGPGARVHETVAAGYVYQGQWVRPVVVKISEDPAAAGETSAVASGGAGEGEGGAVEGGA
ncbi:MAG: hypothetical protein IT580_07240 [Verrucomicrobiales bacterium]|nr:hypothetical protein [Verrucomicrobiales bacterium]